MTKPTKENEDAFLMPDDIQSENIGFGQILMRTIDRIHILMAKGLSYSTAIYGLQAMMTPYFDDKYNKKIEELKSNINQEIKQTEIRKRQTGKKYSINNEMHDMELFALLMALMDRHNLLLSSTTEETI